MRISWGKYGCCVNRLVAVFAALVVVIPSVSSGQESVRQISATLTTVSTHVFHNEVFTLTLSISSTGVRLGKSFSLLSIPGEDRMRHGGFRELPIERKRVGSQVFEIRRFETDARLLQPGRLAMSPVLRVGELTRRKMFIGSRWVETARDVPVKPLILTVVPLPELDRPDNFSGAVGQFSMEVEISPRELAVGDLITAITKIRGSGYVDRIVAPQIPAGRHFKVYNAKSLPVSADGERTFEQILVPQSTNATGIPAVSFCFFDPAAGTYATRTQGPFSLTFKPPRSVDFEPFRPKRVLQKPSGAAPGKPVSSEPVASGGAVSASSSPFRETDSQAAMAPLTGPYLLLLAGCIAATVVAGCVLTRMRQRLSEDRVRKIAAIAATALLLLLVWSSYLYCLVEDPWSAGHPEVVLLRPDSARLAPAYSSLSGFDLPRGVAVRVIETHEGWVKVECGSDCGWVPADAVRLPSHVE